MNFICERKLSFSFFFLKYLVYTLKSHWLQCWTWNILKKFENVSASLNLENIFWFFHLEILRLKLWIFSCLNHFWYSKLFNFLTRHLKLRNLFSFRSYLNWTLKFFEIFSNPVDLNWTLKIFWIFFNLVWLELDFEIFWNFFQTQLVWTGLWKFFEICQTWIDWVWTLFFSFSLSAYVFELAYIHWTALLFTNPTVLYLVDIPPSNV